MKRAATVVLAFASLTVASGQVGTCPSGFENFSSDPEMLVCLQFALFTKGTFDDLRAICQAERADLAQIDCDLHHKVYEYIIQHSDLKDEGFWIGGTDAGHEGIWRWINNGVEMEMGTPHWYPGQPDGDYDENYACLFPPDFHFHSCDNNNKLYAICQI